MFLTEDELVTLTGRKTARTQSVVLSQMGINFKLNAIGKVIVLRSHAEQVISGERNRSAKIFEPNWAAVR
jgi:hypothetical protein